MEEDLYDTLQKLDLHPRRSGKGWSIRCPKHDDRKTPLVVNLNVNTMRIGFDSSGLTRSQILEMEANW